MATIRTGTRLPTGGSAGHDACGADAVDVTAPR
jgi:hypothetical protein